MEEFFDRIEILNNSLQKYQKNKDKILSVISTLSINHKNELNNIIDTLDNINNKINEISDDIDDLQYKIDNNELDTTPEIEERIRVYDKSKKIFDIYKSYIFLYSLMSNS